MKYFILVIYYDGDELLDAIVIKEDTGMEASEQLTELRRKAREATDGNVSIRAYSLPRLVSLKGKGAQI